MNNLYKRDLLQAVGSLRRKLRNSVHLNAEKEPCANSISSSGTRVARIFPRRLLPENRLEFFSTFCTDECDEFHFSLANNLILLFFLATLSFFFFFRSFDQTFDHFFYHSLSKWHTFGKKDQFFKQSLRQSDMENSTEHSIFLRCFLLLVDFKSTYLFVM